MAFTGPETTEILYKPQARIGRRENQSPGGGTPLYKVEVCAAPKGMVFEPFWSENGYRF